MGWGPSWQKQTCAFRKPIARLSALPIRSRYIRGYLSQVKGFALRSLLPSGPTLLLFLGAGALLSASDRLLLGPALAREAQGGLQLSGAAFLKAAAPHVAVGVVVLAGLGLLVGTRTERSTLQAVKALWRAKKQGGGADGQQAGGKEGDAKQGKAE